MVSYYVQGIFESSFDESSKGQARSYCLLFVPAYLVVGHHFVMIDLPVERLFCSCTLHIIVILFLFLFCLRCKCFIGLQQVWFSAITFLGIQRMHLGEYWIVVTLANWCTRVECKYLLRLGFTLFYSQYSTINKCSLFLSLFLFFLLLAYSSINVFSMQHLGGKCALCPTLSFSIYVILFLLNLWHNVKRYFTNI